MSNSIKKPNPLKIIIICTLINTVLAGCSPATNVRNPSSFTKISESQIKTFQALVEKNELQKAYDLYKSNDVLFESTPESKSAADKLASEIQKKWSADIIDKLTNDLEEIKTELNPTDKSRWPYIKTKTSKSNQILQEISDHPVIGKRNPFGIWQSAIMLKNAHDNVSKVFLDALQNNLEQSEFENNDFFNDYPLIFVDEYKESISKQIFPTIQKKLVKSGLEQSSNLLRIYEKYLDHPERARLATLWIKQYAKNTKLSQPLSPKQRISALQSFSSNPENWLNILAVPINNSHQESVTQVSKPIGNKSTPPIEISEIDKTIKIMKGENYDFILFISVSPINGSSQIIKQENEPAKYLVKEEKRANPELDKLRQDLEYEQKSLSEIQQSNSTSAMINSFGNQADKDIAILSALSTGLGKLSESQAQQSVERAKKALNSAPQTTTAKIHADYQRTRITRKHIAEIPIDILIYDTASKKYYAVNDAIKKEKEFIYTAPHSIKQSDSDPPTTLLLAKMWETMATELREKNIKEYSFNLSQLASSSSIKVASWKKQVEKNQAANNEKLFAELSAASKPWSSETDSPLQLYKKIKQRLQ